MVLNVLKPEASFDAQVSVGDGVIAWRCHLDDFVVLHVKGERTANTAVRADRVGLRLLFFFPCAGLAHVVLTRKHERASRADLDAVAAIDACRIGEIHIEFGRDSDVEASACNPNGKCVLPLFTASVDALVTHDALRIVAHVELVVDLDWLKHIGDT